MHNTSEPISRHCICDSHLCNFYELLNGGDDKLAVKTLLSTQSHDHNEENQIEHEPSSTQNNAFQQITGLTHLLLISFVYLLY